MIDVPQLTRCSRRSMSATMLPSELRSTLIQYSPRSRRHTHSPHLAPDISHLRHPLPRPDIRSRVPQSPRWACPLTGSGGKGSGPHSSTRQQRRVVGCPGRTLYPHSQVSAHWVAPFAARSTAFGASRLSAFQVQSFCFTKNPCFPCPPSLVADRPPEPSLHGCSRYPGCRGVNKPAIIAAILTQITHTFCGRPSFFG